MKVVLGIKKSHKVKSSRVLTIGVSHDTSIGERILDDRVSLSSSIWCRAYRVELVRIYSLSLLLCL